MKNYDLIKQFDALIERVLPEEVLLEDTLSNMVLDQNSVAREARQVSLETVKNVAVRSLTASVSLAPEVRYFAALRDVTNFLSLATEGSRPNGSTNNTDLLPVGHPDSTQEHNLGPTSYRSRRGEWYAADPRIESEYVRGLVASAFSANPRTARYAHSMARLHSLPSGELPRDLLLNPITAGLGHAIGNAIKDAVFKGKNSSFWRSLRAKAQLRDEKGRFEFEGGGLSAHVRFPDGNVYQVSGKMAGNSTTDGDVELELKGIPGLKDGIYDVPANKTTAARALLPQSALAKVKKTLVPENAFRNDIIDIRDLLAKETPDGWARSNFEEPTAGMDHPPTPDETFTSGDGYNVALYRRSTPALEKYIEDAKGMYDVTTIGDDGTGTLTPGEPVYAVIGSKRGDSEVIGFTNDWASVQKIVYDEDKKHPQTENESLTPEEQPVKPKAFLPATQPNLMEESDEEEEAPFNPDEGMPDSWEKVGENEYASKDGRFNVSYVFGPSGSKLVYDSDSGETYFEDAGTPVNHFRIKDNKGPQTDDTFRTWEQISAFANQTHQNDLEIQRDTALLPEFDTPEEDEYYHSLDPIEQLAYNNFGPDSSAVWKAETFIDDYMERMFPGTHTYENFNHNGFWFSDYVGATANLTDNEDGTHSGVITQDRTGKVLAQSDKIDPNEANEWLNYELAKLYPVPEEFSKFDFNKARKEYNSTNGKNSKQFADGLDAIVGDMLKNGYDDLENKTYGRDIDQIADLSSAIRHQNYVNDPLPKADLMEEEVGKERRPNKAQANLLWRLYKEAGGSSRVPADIRQKVSDLFNNPDGFTMDEWAELKRLLEQNALPKGSSVPETPTISEAQKKFISDLLRQKQTTPERRTEILEKLNGENGAKFAKGEASEIIGELKAAPGLNAAPSAPEGATPKYLKNAIPEALNGPTNDQLVYAEALIENRAIPDDVVKDFMDRYQHMSLVDFIYTLDEFQNYPFKDKYSPTELYTNLGDKGASPRQLASFERIFGKGLVSEEEMANLKRLIPNMYRGEVGDYLVPLKKLEDAYDIEQLEKAIAEGRSTEGLRVPEGWKPPEDKPELEKAQTVTADENKAERTEDEIHKARIKRRKEARNLRKSLKRLIDYFNDQRDTDKNLRAAGRKIIDGAVADLIGLKTAIDMRRAYPLSAEKVDERLAHIIDGMDPNSRAYSYGKTTNEASRAAIENLAASVHDIIGDYSGYSPNLDDHFPESIQDDEAGGIKLPNNSEESDLFSNQEQPGPSEEEAPALEPEAEPETKEPSEGPDSAEKPIVDMPESEEPTEEEPKKGPEGSEETQKGPEEPEETQKGPDEPEGPGKGPEEPEGPKKPSGPEEGPSEPQDLFGGNQPETEFVHGDEIQVGDKIMFGGKERVVSKVRFHSESGTTTLELEPIDDREALNRARYRDYEKVERVLAKKQEEAPLEPVKHPGSKPYGAKRLSPKAFQGPALEPLRDAKDWQEVKDFFDNTPHFVADTETTGLRDKETPEIQNDATQVTIHKIVNGKIVDTFNSYINPESPISDWVKRNVPNGQGGFVNEEFLADKPTAAEIVPKIKEFLGDNPIIIGHNFVGFDDDVMQRLFAKAGEEFKPGGYVDTLGLADHVMHDWSEKDPRGPFGQKMKWDSNLGREVLTNFKAKGLNPIVSYYKAKGVEGLQTEGAHSSLVDTHNNHVIFQEMLKDAIAGDVKDEAKNFDFDATGNDFDRLLPGYQERVKAADKRMDDWLEAKAKYDAWYRSTPQYQIEQDLKKIAEARKMSSTQNKEGTPQEDPTLATTSAPVPEDVKPVTVSLVQEDPANKIKAPSPKQLASVERRLQMEGVVDPDRAKQIWDLLPHLTNKDIGDIVKEMDVAEFRHRMRNNLPIADLAEKRMPVEILDEIQDYLRNGPDAEKLGPTSPDLLEETVHPNSTMTRAKYAKNVLERALESDRTDIDEDGIISAIHRLDQAIEELGPQADLMSETVNPHPNKYDPSDLDKIDVDFSHLPIQPTEEGSRIIKAVSRGDNVVVIALAGTGKTTTLQASALEIKRKYPNKRILYVVFNNDMAKEARLRMPDNVEVRTMDSISYRSSANVQMAAKFKKLGSQFDDKNKPVVGYLEISRYLKVPAEVQLNNGKKISGATATLIALNGLENWCLSDDKIMSRKHFDMGDLKDENYVPDILDIASKIWKNLLTKHDDSIRQIKPSFNHMMKNFALNNPDFSDANDVGLAYTPDFIFVDEAQDTNRVFYRVIEDQKDLHKNGIAVTAVGDPNQAIYGWRGAVNALDLYKRDVTLPLTLMFRGGQAIAEVGNLVLQIKDSGKEVLRGNPAKSSNLVAPGSMTDADAIITRTNAGGLDEILTLMERNQIPGVPRTFKDDLSSYIASLKWLYGVGVSKYGKKPYRLHEAVLPYENGNWSDMLKAIAENPDPAMTRFFSIQKRIEARLEKQGKQNQMYDVFKEIEKAIKGSRIYGVKGFKQPDDGDWGTSGDLGNKISYEVRGGKLRLFNTGRAHQKSITDPNEGVSNNKELIGSLGFVCDAKGTWDWVKDVESDGKKELDQLYNALAGNDIDTTVMTVHRAKGLEFPNVKIADDWKKPDQEKDKEAVEKGELPAYLADEELNNAYVAITRAKESLDLGSLAWVEEEWQKAKENKASAESTAAKYKPDTTTPDKLEEMISDKTNQMAQVLDSDSPEGIKDAYHGMAAFTSGPDLAQSTANLMSETPPKNNPKVNQKAVDELIKKIIDAMDEGVIPWKKPWDGSGNYLPTSGATGKNYKGINLFTLMLFAQMNGWNGTRWYTKNAIAKLGGYVNDEDGVGIIKVTKYEYKVKPVDGLKVKDPKTGAEKEDDGTRIGTGIRGDIVFNEDVIKGITLPPATKLKEAPPTHEVEGILLDSYSDHPEITHVPQDAAFYRPDTDKIYLPLREQFHSTEEYLDTLFHELTHSTMAPHRLDRKSDLDLDKYGTHKDVRAREELVAEMGSAILSSIFGVNTDIKNVAAYVQSWKKFLEHEPQALYEAASLSSKAVEHMLRGWNGHLDQEEEDEYEQPEAVNMPIGDITGEDGTSGGLGGGVNYRIEGNRIFLMGDTFNKKDIVKSVSLIPNGKKIPFSFFWDKKANNWSISLEDPAQRVQILNELKAKLA